MVTLKKQLRIDYINKIYKIGNFKIMKANSTAKAIDEKISELQKLGFEEA